MAEYDVAAAVDAGFVLLTLDLGEGWVNKINLDELDVASLESCPLGQLYGHYGPGHEHLTELTGVTGTDAHEMFNTDHGFDAPHPGDGEYAALDAEWKRRITQAR